MRLRVGLLFVIPILTGCVSMIQSLGEAAGYYSISYVRTELVPEREVIPAFRQFANAEHFTCGPVVNQLTVILSCSRAGGIHLNVFRETGRIKFISEMPYGVVDTNAFKTLNARLAKFLRDRFKDAAGSS